MRYRYMNDKCAIHIFLRKFIYYIGLIIGLISISGCMPVYECPKVRREILEKCLAELPINETNCQEKEYSIDSEENVLMPAHVKAYGVGRYQDPNNSKLMHERHVVYRLEQEPRWRYNIDNSRQILIGNTLTDSRCTYQPALLDKEIALELQKQRIASKNLQKVYKNILDIYEKLEISQYECLKTIEKFFKVINEVSEENTLVSEDKIPKVEKDNLELIHTEKT